MTAIPKTMRAARFYTAHDLRVEEIPAPQPADMSPADVIIRVRECGICGTDLHEYEVGPLYTSPEPNRITGVKNPVTLGHEFSGEVVAVGDAVTAVKLGDAVAVMPQIVCGSCAQCRAGRQQTCLNLAATGYTGAWGGLAEYAMLREEQVSPLKPGMSFTQGALVEPVAVAVHSISNAPVRLGDAVLVTGGGPIGQLAALAAKAAGAATVVLSEPNPARRSRAAGLGITRVVNPIDEDLDAISAELTDGLGYNVCIEASGGQPALDGCLANVSMGGTIMQTAMAVKPMQIKTDTDLTMRDVVYKGSYIYPVTSWPRVIGLLDSGAFPADQIVTRRLPLERVAEAIEVLADPAGSDLKIIIEL